MSDANDTYSAITLKFDETYVINQLTFDARPLVWEDSTPLCGEPEEMAYNHEIKNPYMYVLEVSKNGSDWSVVIDHSICKCYFTQELHFPRHAARYQIRTM